MKTLQEIYNRIRSHLLSQNARAIHYCEDGSPLCLYGDTKTGRRCAVGCLLPFDVAVRMPIVSVGHASVDGYTLADALLAVGVDVKEVRTLALLKECQNIHDGFMPHRWEEELTKLATRFDLTP